MINDIKKEIEKILEYCTNKVVFENYNLDKQYFYSVVVDVSILSTEMTSIINLLKKENCYFFIRAENDKLIIDILSEVLKWN